jgi:cytochrome c oxidase accessory protein FixG
LNPKKENIDFRNNISTVDTKGKRKWLYVLKPKGRLHNLRTIATIIYLVLFFSLPFIKINGNPAFLFNLPEAKFVFFGQAFFPQDFIVFGIGMLTLLLFIIVFTLVFGRAFCGWACPQTIFMEMVFRKIEYWIEGNANRQRIADRKEWTTSVWIRKIIKHIIFFGISLLIANTFLAYIIGIDELQKIISEPISEHVVGFIAIIFFTVLFYAVYAFVREIVCTVICPYGRLQSVLLDKNSVIVSYDYQRGEPRGKIKKNSTEELGDCIDCSMCVQVCPTGIDIRNGVQMECINCTACIDACNMMMEKVNRPLNLIKFASENNIAKNERFHITARIKGYSAVLLGLIAVFVLLLVTRTVFDATVLRVPGQVLQENNDGSISNLYRIKITNKSNEKLPYAIHLKNKNARIEFVGTKLDSLLASTETEETFFIKMDPKDIPKRKQEMTLDIMSSKEIIQTKTVSFIGEY